MSDVLRFERRSTYTGKVIPCRDCPFPATVIVFPRIDHRRRKPWPTSYGLCADHAATGTETTK